MDTIRLDGYKMVDREAAHAYLKRKLSLPAYYGHNLDALWDCLTADFRGKKIIITHPEMIIEQLGTYGQELLRLFQEAAEENADLQVVVEEAAAAESKLK